jgi:hypothetical protein
MGDVCQVIILTTHRTRLNYKGGSLASGGVCAPLIMNFDIGEYNQSLMGFSFV